MIAIAVLFKGDDHTDERIEELEEQVMNALDAAAVDYADVAAK